MAQAEGELLLYLNKLIERGEIAFAVAEANACLAAPFEVLTIARLPDEKGHRAEALRVAAPGLESTYPYHRAIYVQHNRLAEWQPYLTGLLDTHARKYKLVPLLKALSK